MELVDTSEKAQKYWSAFNAAVSSGAEITMRLPDDAVTPSFSEKMKHDVSAMKGYKATVIDKSSSNGTASIILDEYASVLAGNAFYTTAELSCSSTLPAGTGILEFANPSERLKYDLALLKHNDPLYVNYIPSFSQNNVRSFTVNFYSDETLLNNRIRLYLNEAAVSENRNGMYTELRGQSVTPQMTVDIQVIYFSKTVNTQVTEIKDIVPSPIETQSLIG